MTDDETLALADRMFRDIEQDRVNTFADATGDHQWIHVDTERAASGPFGGTIAHGFLTLSLIPMLGVSIFTFDTPGAKLNYGVNKVRFPNPLLVGSRIRASATLTEVAAVAGGVQTTMLITVEIEGGTKPACVIESISRYLT